MPVLRALLSRAPCLRRARLLCLLGMLTVAGGAVRAEDGDFGAAFLRIPTSARALAMGRASTAAGHGVGAIFWDPSGLASSSGPVEVEIARMVAGAQEGLTTGALAGPVSDWFGSLGVGYQGLSISGIKQYDEFDRLTGEFETGQHAFLAGYGRHVAPFRVGAVLKYVSVGMTSAGSPSAGGFGLNVGLSGQVRLAPEAWRVRLAGVYRDDFDLEWSSNYRDHVPMSLRLGAAVYPWDREDFCLALDLEQVARAPLLVFLGSEWWLHDAIALRAGVANVQFENRAWSVSSAELLKSTVQFSGGFGLRLNRQEVGALSFDYGFATHPYLADTHMLTLGYGHRYSLQP